jgi:hypothetical protein
VDDADRHGVLLMVLGLALLAAWLGEADRRTRLASRPGTPARR